MRRTERERERVDADVASLIAAAVDPYGVARARERDAATEKEARYWRRVAIGVAKGTGRRVGLDTATRMALDIDR